MDRFLLRMEQLPGMAEPLQELLELVIETIGNIYRGFPLRLYCMALNEELVILFNGGIKDAQTAQESSDVISAKLYEANGFAKRILQAIQTGEIVVHGRTLTDYAGRPDIYL